MTHECSCRHEVPLTPGQAPRPVRAEQTVADVVQHRAGALNHCCGAHLSLQEAAAAAGVPIDALLAALNESPKAPA
jgi:iron-sulfur cluster repair protein YtfE (RIC family)